jgi:L-serine dehydratase
VDIESIADRLYCLQQTRKLALGLGLGEIRFDSSSHIIFLTKPLEAHPNGLQFLAYDHAGVELLSATYLSVGGGFIRSVELDSVLQTTSSATAATGIKNSEISFRSANDLLSLSASRRCSISDLMRQHERTWRTDAEINRGLLQIWSVMQDCVIRGCRAQGTLPGGFKVRRRAADLYRQLTEEAEANDVGRDDPLRAIDWINLFALAVGEENAAGGRVVTAPTNGAAGIIPAVLHYYIQFVPGAGDVGVVRFLLTASAIGFLYKMNASLSGAEVGCQGEVGVACSMAAGALCEILGGSSAQVENAAEIAMEHHLGLTCDPVGGLVQIPCIERNAIAAVKAVNAARMAMRGDGVHTVSLDKVIKTMWETGADMQRKYKETARGGLAVNIVEC